jgi:ferredoxin-NADP reductase
MFERALAPINRWALEHIDREWVDYLVSNTMTELNRWLNGFVWTYDIKAQVVRVTDEAPGVKTFELRPNQHWSGMVAGQYVELIAHIDGQEVRRCYSPTRLANGRLSVTVKAVSQGVMSNWLHQHARPGTTLRLGRPSGRFCLEASQRRVLMLCAGSGITPCHSMVQDALQNIAQQGNSHSPDIQVIAQFRTAQEVVFKDALKATWPEAGVKVTVALSQGTAPDSVVRLDATTLMQQCPDLKERDIFLCGPDGFMAQMIRHLHDLGMDMARVHTERFVNGASPVHGPGDFKVAGTEVCFQHLGETITLTVQDQGKTLLDIARAHDVYVESGCCQGMCGTCRLTVHDGQASGNVLGKVVYLCTAYPASSRLVLDA